MLQGTGIHSETNEISNRRVVVSQLRVGGG